MGVPILGLANVWGDNKGIVNSASIPETRITKNYLGICYYAFREASEQGIWKVGFCKGVNNIEDFLTKMLSGTAKEKSGVEMDVQEVDSFATNLNMFD